MITTAAQLMTNIYESKFDAFDEPYETIYDRLAVLLHEDDDVWLNIRQVMWVFGCSQRSVQRWIDRESVPYILDEHEGFMYGHRKTLVPITQVIIKIKEMVSHPHD
jgi:hypothetical protein